MATLIDGLAEVLEVDFSDGVQDSLPDLDSLYRDISTDSMRVRRDGIGQSWQVIHTFREGISGAFKWQSVGGGTLMTGLSHVDYLGDNPTTFPGLDEQVTPGHFQKTISLAKGVGNLFLSTEFLHSTELTAAITDVVAEVIRGAAENCALAEIQCFYAMAASQPIAVVEDASGNFSSNRGTNDRLSMAVANQSVRQCIPGTFVDIYDTAGTTQRNTGPVVIEAVRFVPDDSNDTGGYGRIELQSLSTGTAEDLSAAGVIDTDILVRKDSIASGTGLGPLGPEQWLTATSTDIFGINVTVFQQMQSVLKDVGGVLTNQVLNRYYGRYFKAYGMNNCPESMVTSMGVTNAHVENSDGLRRFESHGRPFVIAEGFEYGAVPYVFNGMNMKWHVSAFMPSTSDVTAATHTGGRLWGLKLRDQNLMRYVPPRIPQSRTMEPFHSEVEFLYPLGGPNGAFKPYHSPTTARATNFQEAPFYRHIAIVPRHMPGIKLTGLTESL